MQPQFPVMHNRVKKKKKTKLLSSSPFANNKIPLSSVSRQENPPRLRQVKRVVGTRQLSDGSGARQVMKMTTSVEVMTKT